MMAMPRLTLLLALATTVACRSDEARTDHLTPERAQEEREAIPADVVALLDSGSAAFRDDDYGRALELYAQATELGPDVAAAWFGVYMAEKELGNVDAAQEALERSRSLMPGATLLGTDDTDPGR